ncbi:MULTISPECIES: nuclear transport factor 2 family protein [Halomonadaceae]|uniref:nuclear transport factor 2 family protein n=1 Tax=Halomonadaceae TaxID=28256 RepID=UPI001D0BAE32|nr:MULTISPECIES: nuclear transport factor 2 family protein [unclassified Halomonas]
MPNAEMTDPDSRSVKQVRAFLSAMEARDLACAERYLAVNVVMQFPGAAPMQRLSEVVEWAKTRYRRVSKTFYAVDLCSHPKQGTSTSHSVVVCHGELAVEWLDGSTSTGVRFIDRFELTDGLITRQDVWNDLALAARTSS